MATTEQRRAAVDSLLHEWAWWRDDRRAIRQMLGYPTTILARLLAGMPKTTCPDCRGAKTRVMPIYRGGKVMTERVDCPTCNGQGWINAKSTRRKINPAFLLGGGGNDNEVLHQIDRAVVALPVNVRRVVWEEYVERKGGDLQYNRAKTVGYHDAHYRRLLIVARDRIAGNIEWDRVLVI